MLPVYVLAPVSSSEPSPVFLRLPEVAPSEITPETASDADWPTSNCTVPSRAMPAEIDTPLTPDHTMTLWVTAKLFPPTEKLLAKNSTEWNCVPAAKSFCVLGCARADETEIVPGHWCRPPAQFPPVIHLLLAPPPSQTQRDSNCLCSKGSMANVRRLFGLIPFRLFSPRPRALKTPSNIDRLCMVVALQTNNDRTCLAKRKPLVDGFSFNEADDLLPRFTWA